MAVAEHLDLDVPRPAQVLFHEHPVITERARCFAPCGREGLREPLGPLDHPHALAAAAGRRLDQHRPADRRGRLGEARGVLILAMVARHQRHARPLHDRLGSALRAHGPDRGGGRPDEHQPRRLAGLGEFRVLGKEPVARMDRLGARELCDLDDPLGLQIALARRRRAQEIGLVAKLEVPGMPVRLGKNRDRPDAEPGAGPGDPAGDLAAIGDQDLLEHGGGYIRNTPNVVLATSAFSAAEIPSPSTMRVSAGAMMPSSQSLALA